MNTDLLEEWWPIRWYVSLDDYAQRPESFRTLRRLHEEITTSYAQLRSDGRPTDS